MIVEDFDPEGLFAGMILPPRFRKRQSETRFIQRWKLTTAQYVAMMRERFVGPKYQRGSIILASSSPSAIAFAGEINLTAHTLTSTALGLQVTSRVKFQTDGTLVHIDNGTDTDEASGEWHTAEPGTFGSLFEVRALLAGKVGTRTAPAAADDIWITLDADRDWGNLRLAKHAPSTNTTSATFELGLDGVESAVDSAIITCVGIN